MSFQSHLQDWLREFSKSVFGMEVVTMLLTTQTVVFLEEGKNNKVVTTEK